MSYEVFARKYRPQTFADVVGQEHITRTLRNALEGNRLAHAYIFVGPRGTGKTSTARILAKSLNCQSSPGPTITPCGECDSCREIAAGNSLDVLEFDAASNTQVDKVREIIIDNVKYAPTRGRYKVYIVDEVHMLSASSFNALLKTLEEPPAHVKFIFATTDVQKVPTTILSRCQRFDLKRIPTAAIAEHLQMISGHENITLSPEAAEAIARGAEGGMRDAESMLDQLVAFCGDKIDEPDVLSVFGLTSRQSVAELCDRVLAADVPGALAAIHVQAEAGRDLSRLMSDLIGHLRNVLVVQADPASLKGEETPETVAVLTSQAGRVKTEKLLELIEQFAGAEQRMRWAPNRKMHFEVALIRAIQTLGQATLSEVLETLSAMRGEGGAMPACPAAPATPAPAPARAAARVAEEPAKAAPSAPTTPTPTPTAETPASTPAPKPAAVAPKPSLPPRPALPPKPAAGAPARAAKPPAPPPPEADSFSEDEASPFAEDAPAAAPVSASQAAAPAPAAAPEPGAADLAGLWAQLLQEVRQKRPLIKMWVEAGQLMSLERGVALVAFPEEQKLAAEQCQTSHRKFLEEALAALAGQPVTLKTEVRAGLEVTPPPLERAAAPADKAADFHNDPLIRKALEIFQAEIQPA